MVVHTPCFWMAAFVGRGQERNICQSYFRDAIDPKLCSEYIYNHQLIFQRIGTLQVWQNTWWELHSVPNFQNEMQRTRWQSFSADSRLSVLIRLPGDSPQVKDVWNNSFTKSLLGHWQRSTPVHCVWQQTRKRERAREGARASERESDDTYASQLNNIIWSTDCVWWNGAKRERET